MTREEAIRIIETVFQDEYVYKYYDSITHQALDMAIEALRNCSEKPNGSLISRQDAKRIVSGDGKYFGRVGRNVLHEMWTDICSLPSADRPIEWIPCSERMPDAEYGEGDSVLCCTELGLMYILYWNGGNWCVPTGEPHIWVNHKTGWHDRVIAWLPLPTPYKGGEEE